MEFEFNRECGILLHPTSLPSIYGVGDIGPSAYEFIDFLKDSKQSIWQILPLNPVGYGESPYQCFSAFASNPMLISLDLLIEEGLLDNDIKNDMPEFDKYKVNFSEVKEFKEKLLIKAYNEFKVRKEKYPNYDDFWEKNRFWLDDFALFLSIKNHFKGLPWNEWEDNISKRDEEALSYYSNLLDDEINYHKFCQFIFFKQWHELKDYANKQEVKIVGDIPIFVAYDSSDLWVNKHLFHLDQDGNPTKVAGVPPDYFSKTGQLWGNPHYRWDIMKQDNYSWWKERFKLIFEMADVIRIDHFRGFESYWVIPAGEETAVNGKWEKGPGEDFFKEIENDLGKLPIIAEDLGIITDEVTKLRKKLNFPGMKVMHFLFESLDKKEYLPKYHEKNMVVYTGTHDNDTTIGWYEEKLKNKLEVIKILEDSFNISQEMTREEIAWKFIEIAYSSEANTAIIPLQDFLCKDSNSRMNIPGTIGGNNWAWRFSTEELNSIDKNKLVNLVEMYNR